MKELVKRFLDNEISRRGFMKGMFALGFSATAIDSVLNSIAYAEISIAAGRKRTV